MNKTDVITWLIIIVIVWWVYRDYRHKPLMPNFLKELDLRQLDTKIIIAAIIGLSAIICTYLYTQNTPLNQCIEPMMKTMMKNDAKDAKPEKAILNCIDLINSHR